MHGYIGRGLQDEQDSAMPWIRGKGDRGVRDDLLGETLLQVQSSLDPEYNREPSKQRPAFTKPQDGEEAHKKKGSGTEAWPGLSQLGA